MGRASHAFRLHNVRWSTQHYYLQSGSWLPRGPRSYGCATPPSRNFGICGTFCGNKVLRRDPWGSAVVCAKAASATGNPRKRAILIYLGEFWLALARHDTSQINEQVAIDLAMIELMQAEILGEVPVTH